MRARLAGNRKGDGKGEEEGKKEKVEHCSGACKLGGLCFPIRKWEFGDLVEVKVKVVRKSCIGVTEWSVLFQNLSPHSAVSDLQYL